MQQATSISNLIQRARSGDNKVLKTIYDHFVLEMLTTSRRITLNMQDAEDVIQESFLKAFQNLDHLQDERKFKSWLKRIVINNSLQRIRKRISWEHIDAEKFVESAGEENWYKGISMNQIQSAIQLLPDGCRQIFSLYLLEDYKHREIAELLNISISTSKSQYRYALSLMKKHLIKNRVE